MGEPADVGEPDRASRRRDQGRARAGQEPGALPGSQAEQAREIDPAHELAGGEGLASGHAELVQPRDSRVLQPAVEPCRMGQKSGPVRIRNQLGVESLDRELPLEAADAVDLGAEDFSGRPAAERVGQVVTAEPASRGSSALSTHLLDGSRQYTTLSMKSA